LIYIDIFAKLLEIHPSTHQVYFIENAVSVVSYNYNYNLTETSGQSNLTKRLHHRHHSKK